MTGLPDFANSTEWTAPKIRVAVSLDAEGHFQDVCADTDGVEIYIVQHSCSNDAVYRMTDIDTGKEMVDFMFNGAPIGHAGDGKSEALARKIFGSDH